MLNFMELLIDNETLDEIVKTLPPGEFQNLPPVPVPVMTVKLDENRQRKMRYHPIRSSISSSSFTAGQPTTN